MALQQTGWAPSSEGAERRRFAEDMMMKDFARKYKAWRVQRQRRLNVVRQLSAYTDRDLLDLGFSRHDFPAIINGTYQR